MTVEDKPVDPRITELAMLVYKLMFNEVWPRMKRDGLTWKDVWKEPDAIDGALK